MQAATLCFLVDAIPAHRVLLGYKKTGFGVGKYSGIGGKIEPGETAAVAVVREMSEETGVVVALTDLRPCGRVTFAFPARPEWDFSVRLFTATAWQGEIEEREEVRPQWFDVSEIPFTEMWQDARYWLLPVLGGVAVDAHFTFEADCETVGHARVECLSD